MKPLQIGRPVFATLFVLLVAVGCNRSVKPLAPLAIEELPSALQKAFNGAKPELGNQANQILASLQAKDFAKAYSELQSLSVAPALTKEQANVASRGMLAVSGQLHSAEAKGDQQAAEILRYQRMTK